MKPTAVTNAIRALRFAHGEMTQAEKHAMSHRGHALASFVAQLRPR